MFNDLRIKYQQNGIDLYQTNESFRNLVLLYWCEGCKNGVSFGFCNTDPKMLTIVYEYLCNLGYKEKIVVDITYHNDKTEQEVKDYWNNIFNTNLNFKCIIEKQAGTSKRKNKHYGGMLSLVIHKVELVQMILGAINGIRNGALIVK